MRRPRMEEVLFALGALPYAFLTSQPTWREHGGELSALAGARAGDHVLDLGCGPGESSFGMARRVPGLRVTGLDFSPVMVPLARLRQRVDRDGRGVDFVRGDVTALPFADAAFDAVTAHSLLYLLSDLDRALAEVRRVLKPGRRCVFLEPARREGAPAFPPDLARRAPREPRFVTSMVLWTLMSRRYGRFDEDRFQRCFERAGLELLEVRRTLSGLGVFGIGRRPA